MSASLAKRRSQRANRHGDDRTAALLADERGTLFKEAPYRVALVYPSPYNAAMSSLGYQVIYKRIHDMPQWAADRAMLPPPADRVAMDAPFATLERGDDVGSYPVLAFSVAYELEIAGMLECMERARVPLLANDRDDRHPLIICGGPLTFSNPAPLQHFADAIIMGEGEELIATVLELASASSFARSKFIPEVAKLPGVYVPSVHGETIPAVAQVADALLPARSVIMTPHAELSNMFLTEAARGCSRGCTYCVMRRTTNGGMRAVDVATILDAIPADAKRVGLVGAAVTDHPDIMEIVAGVVRGGDREIGISSLRADKLTSEFVGYLAKGGYRTLTVAADGASERMRRVIERSTKEAHLLSSARYAAEHRLKTTKIYMMVGVPEETDDDIDELVRFSAELAAAHASIAYGIAPFVAKRNTPLDGTDFAGIDVVTARLARLQNGIRAAGLTEQVEIRSTSAKWAWVEYMLAQGDHTAGLAVLDAYRNGGTFAAYKQAFLKHGTTPTGPRARVLSGREQIAAHKRRLAVLT
ncbi:MAG: radical SAM protein [Myxococcales bacterium]|nr:radical SAM protein [Myxococcales bacterium]